MSAGLAECWHRHSVPSPVKVGRGPAAVKGCGGGPLRFPSAWACPPNCLSFLCVASDHCPGGHLPESAPARACQRVTESGCGRSAWRVSESHGRQAPRCCCSPTGSLHSPCAQRQSGRAQGRRQRLGQGLAAGSSLAPAFLSSVGCNLSPALRGPPPPPVPPTSSAPEADLSVSQC